MHFVNTFNHFSSLAIAKSKTALEPQMRDSIVAELNQDSRWADILEQLHSDTNLQTFEQGLKNYRRSKGLLEV